MRADRLVAVLLLLQARGRVTASAVAAELDVSLATARRDLEALSSAGIPVYPQPGRGGGWALLGGARTDLTGLTAGEARALFLLLGPGAGAVPEARSALRKLVRALPATFRADAEAAADAVVVDPARWGEPARPRPRTVELLEQAVVHRRRVLLHYAGRSGPPTQRLVDPWGLVDKDGVWYLVAGTGQGRRTFRVDRVRSAQVTDEPAERPADLDVGREWNDVVAAVERRRSPATATVHVDAGLVPVLRHRFGRHCSGGDTTSEGRVELRVAAHTVRAVAEQLAGFGGSVQVVAPDAVRAELATIGRELVARNGGG